MSTIGTSALTQERYSLTEKYCDSTSVTLSATGAAFVDLVDVINPLFSDNSAAISRFGRFNTIYRLGSSTGIGTTINLSPDLKLEASYLTNQANNPAPDSGIFNGSYAVLGQVVYSPGELGKIAFTYVNAYNDDGLGHDTGSLAADLGGRRVSSNS